MMQQNKQTKKKQSRLNKMFLVTVLGTTIMVGGIAQSAEASSLWFKNYLQGKTTQVGEVNKPTEEVKAPISTPEQDKPQETTKNWYSNSYWRNRTGGYTASSGSTSNQGSPVQRQPEQSLEPVSNLSGVEKEEQVLLQLLNQERTKRGLKPLRLNSELTRLARLKAKDMADLNYFSHTSPTYGKAVDMVRGAGINHWIAGENIAITSSGSRANALFMGSTTHRSTMLNSHYTEVGIGMYRKSNGSLYVTEIFIGTR